MNRRNLLLTVVAALAVALVGPTGAFGAVSFSDVPASHVFREDVERLAGLGIVNGFPDGTFRPDDPVIRRQMAKIAALATGIHTDPVDNAASPTFADVSPDDGVPYPFDYVEEAAGAGYFVGEAGVFRPYENITRVQLALVLVRAGGDALDDPPAGYDPGFTDVPEFAADEVAKAKYNGILDGKTPTTFDPWSSATRGHVCRMTANLLDKIGEPGTIPQAYKDADGLAGGAAYSQWWTVDAQGSGTKPATTAESDYYRCKACHAWDLMGNTASYADRTGKSTGTASRPDVSAIDLWDTVAVSSIEELFDVVKGVGGRVIDARENTHPDFSANVTDAQVWNMVKFLREEVIDPDLLYDLVVTGPPVFTDTTVDPPVVRKPVMTYSNIGALGDKTAGQALYTAKCAACHGADGTTLDIGGSTLGKTLRSKPYEVWFKVKFGLPGSGMAPGLLSETGDLQDLYAALADAATFPDAAPQP